MPLCEWGSTHGLASLSSLSLTQQRTDPAPPGDSCPWLEPAPGCRLSVLHTAIPPSELGFEASDFISKCQESLHENQIFFFSPGNSVTSQLVGFIHKICLLEDKIQRLHFHFSLSCIGEGNGNTLQCSCLENPRDEGAWWAAVCGVTQSQTQLEQLSSSSSSIESLFSSTNLFD